MHHAEAAILADPRNDWTCADRYATDEMFDALPEGWDQTRYQVKPAQRGRILDDGDVIDLGDRAFEVVHTPGHSPGGIGLFEAKTGIFLSGDIIYDGPLIDDAYHSDVGDYVATLERLRALAGVRRAWRAFPELRADALWATDPRISGRPSQARLPSDLNIFPGEAESGISAGLALPQTVLAGHGMPPL